MSVREVLSRWNMGTFTANGIRAELCGKLGTWIVISYGMQIDAGRQVQIQPDPVANAIVRRLQPPRNQTQVQVSMGPPGTRQFNRSPGANSQHSAGMVNPTLGYSAPNFEYHNVNSRAEPLLPEIENINITKDNTFPNQHTTPCQVRKSRIENVNYPMAPQSQWFDKPNNGDYQQM